MGVLLLSGLRAEIDCSGVDGRNSVDNPDKILSKSSASGLNDEEEMGWVKLRSGCLLKTKKRYIDSFRASKVLRPSQDPSEKPQAKGQGLEKPGETAGKSIKLANIYLISNEKSERKSPDFSDPVKKVEALNLSRLEVPVVGTKPPKEETDQEVGQ